MQILVLSNVALIFALALASFLGFNSEAMAAGAVLPSEPLPLAAVPSPDLQDRALPLAVGLLLIGVTYRAAWHGWRQSLLR